MGGIKINESTETCVDGLLAAGEVCGGIHGANRLGGNGLAEAFVFGRIAGERAAQRALAAQKRTVDNAEVSTELERLNKLGSGGGEDIKEIERLLKTAAWNQAGIIRNEQGLKLVLEEIAILKERFNNITLDSYNALVNAVKLGNILVVSEMVARAALLRTESRGAHYRTDHPEEDNGNWLKNVVISQQDGQIKLAKEPVITTKVSLSGAS